MEGSSQNSPDDRKALAFNIPTRDENSNPPEEEDDSFYDLTLEELKSIYSSLQKQKAIQDKLLPKAKREEEEQKLRPPKKEYQWTVVRIELPSRVVLQGQFKPHEKIKDVKEFIRAHIKEPGLDFNLFTAPPKKVLQDEAKLADLGLVPSVKLYIDSKSDCQSLLLSDRTNLVTFNCAQETASAIRKPVSKPPKESTLKADPPSSSEPIRPQEPSTSGQSTKKVPKWFKMKK